ncbi:dienelactone hydrolase family protein [Sphingobium phenoxybenzoativorans]|uniref:dienelactone hydrolase family protein n=1 Tax=Sphingobium phenoxybenzoativorans TaxID=1592790 RepID=UPI000872E885|nr:dienelactone hydrolase family protein [Sphingobium phenoxybenzoativorans]
MGIERRVTIYDGPGGPFEGMAIADPAAGPRPGLLLIPNVLGTKEDDFLRGEKIAALGYSVFVADVFGQGKRPTRDDPDRARYMTELNNDRTLLKARLGVSLDALKAMPETDPSKCAAFGFCFGGKCVLDMARAGLDVKGVVSFHGVYDAPPYPNVTPIGPKVLVCHGWDDPLCPPDATAALAKELTEGKADWQIHAYGHTGHAFTDESVNMPGQHFGYSPDADRRSWKASMDFLEEIFA